MRTGLIQQYVLVSLISFILLLLLPQIAMAQPGQPDSNNQYPYARFSPSMAVIIAVLIAALFFMGFFSIYIRHCSDASRATAGSVGRALSLRARRAAAARGLDQSVIQTFPTFSYSEVKDHQIGKGTALECAVCLNEFEENETLRLLPKCDHVFHPECIDAWLESHVTCPVCRANLSPQAADEPPTTDQPEEVVIQVEDAVDVDEINQEQRTGSVSRNSSFDNTSHRTQRSWSMKIPTILGFGKFRSHSTGHSLVQPGDNLERFTLRLPEGVRKEVMDRAMLNRARSFATVLPTEGSSRRGYRTGGAGEEAGSGRAGKFYQRIEIPGRDIKSDRWGFFTRGLSFRSPRVKSETGEGSTSKSGGGGKTPVKMPSFRCLTPKADAGDESHPIAGKTAV